MFLSIIIPVYRVEEFIDQCLESVLEQQSATGFEVIAVDDGSPDNCGNILDGYAKRHTNLKVIHQQNQGLSMARNNGLAFATGEYVWFVDSDDWIEPDAVEAVHGALLDNPDILEIGFNYAWTDRMIPSRKYVWQGLIPGCQAFLKKGLSTPAQFTIVKRSLLIDNELRFYPGILHEDTEYKPRLAILAKTAACLAKPLYNYRQRESGNIMSSYGIRNARDIITACRSLERFALDRPYNKQEHAAIGDAIGVNLNHLLNRLAHHNGSDKAEIIKHLKDNIDLLDWLNKSDKLKYRFEARMFSLNFNLAFRLLQFSQLHR